MGTFPLIQVLYHGDVSIDYWEYVFSIFYIFLIYLYFARKKNQRIKKFPEYRHYIWGFMTKILGGVAFGLIYFYYYEGGDTLAYFYSAVSMSKLFKLDALSYFTVLFSESSLANRSFFNLDTGYPYGYVYYDPRSFFVIRSISPLVILAMESYLITTVILASISYIGVWKAYRTFVSYFPSLTTKLAVAFLYMPSVIFWGSAILKDTFTFSATCWWVHCMDELFIQRRDRVSNAFGLFLSGMVIVIVKPYIFMVLLPLTLIWTFHGKIAKIRNVMIKFLFLPATVLGLIFATFLMLSWLGQYLDKFSLDKALTTIEITQGDLSRAEQYGSNYFDIGELDGTWTGVLSKFPIATNAALFRPYLWESESVVMVLSALENLFLMLLLLYTLVRTRVVFFIRCLLGNHIVMFCILFALLFGFVIGVSTPNFGALVRFKIPLIPFFVSGLYIVNMMEDRRRALRHRGVRIDLGHFRKGEPRFVHEPRSEQLATGRLARS